MATITSEAPPRTPAGGPIRSRLYAVPATLAAHRVFAVAVAVGVVIRVIMMLGYRPAVLYYGDSYAYLDVAEHPRPMWGFQPSGYPLFLWLLSPLHSLVAVATVQHAMGIGMAVMVYALLRRRFRLPGWGATLAAVPLLFDNYLIEVEHSVLADTLFMFLVVAGVTAALWRRVPTVRLCLVAGVCLSLAALARTVGLPLLLILVVWLVVRRVGWWALGATVAVCGLLLVSYGAWYHQDNGRFALSGGEGLTLWARTMTFANCRVINPPADERPLCPNGTHQEAASEYVWATDSSLARLGGWTRNNDRARSFAIHAIEAQPLDYLGAVGKDLSLAFHWNRAAHPARVLPAYQWGKGSWPLSDKPGAAQTIRRYDSSVHSTGAAEPYAAFSRTYQKYFFVRGPVLGLLLVLGAVGLFFTRRYLLAYGVGVVLLVVPVAVLDFDHRYVLPVLPLVSLSAAVAVAEIGGRLRRRGAGVAAAQDRVDRVEECCGRSTSHAM